MQPIFDKAVELTIMMLSSRLESLKELAKTSNNNDIKGEKVEIYGKTGNFAIAAEIIKLIFETINQKKEALTFSIYTAKLAVFLFLNRYQKNQFEYADEIYQTFSNACYYLPPTAPIETQLELSFLQLSYVSLFKTDSDFENHLKSFNNTLEETTVFLKYIYYQRIAKMFEIKGMFRKCDFWLYRQLVLITDNKAYDFQNITLLQNLKKRFRLDSIQFLYPSLESYNAAIYLKILKSWKKTAFLTRKPNEVKLRVTTKKKLDKNAELRVETRKVPGQIEQYWKRIQLDLIVRSQMQQNDQMTRVQALIFIILSYGYGLRKDELEKMIVELKVLANKINVTEYNLECMPMVFNVVPVVPSTRFDYKEIKNDKNQIFLHNPWEKKSFANYYWSVGSIQNINLQLFNKLPVAVEITDMELIFDSPVNTIKTTVFLSEREFKSVNLSFIPICENIITLTGIRYKVFEVNCFQWLESKGRSFYSLVSPVIALNENKKVSCELSNIKVFPEIPNLKIYCDSIKQIDDISLGEKRQFTFVIENKGNQLVTSIELYVYTFKKVNLKNQHDKIMLPDVVEVGKSTVVVYEYWHTSYSKGVEFCFFVKGTESVSSSYKMFPYLLMGTSFRNINLIEVENVLVFKRKSADQLLDTYKKLGNDLTNVIVMQVCDFVIVTIRISNSGYRETLVTINRGDKMLWQQNMEKRTGISEDVELAIGDCNVFY